MTEAVEFQTSDGITLRGQLERRGPYWTVLTHDVKFDLDSLAPLADVLTRAEFTVLGIDLRGHGLSDGDADEETIVIDVTAAARWCREAGAGQVFAVAAGLGAAGVLGAPAESPVAAAVLLSPAVPTAWLDGRVRNWAGPKLFIVGSQDESAERAVRNVFDACIGPRLFSELPSSDYGHQLISGDCAAQALSQTVGYLTHNRSELGRAA